MPYDKPFLTVEQQLEKLKVRGLRVSDEARATAYLRRIGYYRLSGYWYPLRETLDDKGALQSKIRVGDGFKPNVDFSHIVDLYVFDKKLRLALLDAIERVEVGIRTSLVIHMGRYGPWAHRNTDLLDGTFTRRIDRLSGRTHHQEWLRRLDEISSRSDEQFAKHFREKYPGDLMPIWIASELWDFGILSRFYAGLRYRDRQVVSIEYGVQDPGAFESWLRSINFVRNVCAHHSRLWNRALVRQPAFPKRGVIPMLDHVVGNTHRQTRLYGTAAAVRFLLLTINPSTRWPERLREILETLPSSPYLDLNQTGFFPGWERLPLWASPEPVGAG